MRILAWSISVSLLLLLGLVRPFNALEPAAAGTDTAFKVAYYNIQSGMGMTQLSGTCSFERNSNCTDPSKPLNAWGKGVVQAELERAVKNDPAIIALGVSEAWTCAHPDAILKTLGWATHTGERNGVSLLARFGFAGTPEWFQLDTSLNANPSDTQWVVRAPVCADASCSRSVQVFSAHWYASGETRTESFERQARDTVQFMDRLPPTEARVLVGDLNVWEEGGPVCNQTPVPTAVQILRDAGNLDAWPSVHGTAEGYTGMWNRNGCGQPNGYLWKRIDRSWSKGLPAPVSMTRFGMVTPGACAPSDHAGIIVEYAWPGEETAPVINSAPSASFGTVCSNLDCTFTDLSTDAEGPIAAWSWAFGDGTTSTVQHPTRRYAGSGTYNVSLSVTDGQGATSTTARTVTVTASTTAFDFSLAASPSSRKINAGAKTTYSVAASLLSGTTEPVKLSISGLPAGSAGSFSPESLTPSASSTLTVTTSASTPAGTYALTITGTGGGVTRTSSVSLQVVKRR